MKKVFAVVSGVVCALLLGYGAKRLVESREGKCEVR